MALTEPRTSSSRTLATPSDWLPTYGTQRSLDRPTLGPKVGKVMRMLGLPPMPWQQHVFDVAYEIDPNTGHFAYRFIDIVLPRRSGKTSTFLGTTTHRAFGMGANDPQAISYTAQTAKDARKRWERDFLRALQRSSLRDEFTTRLANGHEEMRWANGSVFGLLATTEKAGHGDTIDMPVADEIFAQTDDRIDQASIPAMLTRPMAQMWTGSTPGESPAKSPYMWARVERGREAVADGRRSGVAYFEWSDETTRITDADSLADAAIRLHPAVGYTIEADTLRADIHAMSMDEAMRAYLCRWGAGSVDGPIPMAAWDGCGVDAAAHAGGITLGVDVSPDRGRASIVAIGDTDDGVPLVELVDNRQGVGWVVARLGSLVARHEVTSIVVDRKSQAGTLVDDIKAAGLPLVCADVRELITGCGRFYDAVTTGQLVHLGQPEFASAVAGAKRRTVADAWALSRKSSAVDISPLVAAVLALWCHETNQTPDGDEPGPVFLY